MPEIQGKRIEDLGSVESAAERSIKRARLEGAEDCLAAFCTRKVEIYDAMVLARAWRESQSALGTEQTMHAAWRKRAEEAEAALRAERAEALEEAAKRCERNGMDIGVCLAAEIRELKEPKNAEVP